MREHFSRPARRTSARYADDSCPVAEVHPVPGWLSSLRDLIVEASPLRRFMLALLVLLPLVALGAAYIWLHPPVYRVLYGKLSDRAGGEVIAALDQLDIPYRLRATDGGIEVPADQLHAARYRLAAQGLPRTDAAVQDEAARAPRFGASSLQEQQQYQHALEVDLAHSIQTLDAVDVARVHLALPKVSPFLREAPPATAAVLVRLRDGGRLAPDQVATIQTLVSAAVPRLKREDVQVLDPRGVLLSGAALPSQPRIAVEQDLARRVLGVLEPWLGRGHVNVQVAATLDETEVHQTVERVRNVVVDGRTRPLERTVRTTLQPEGRLQRVSAIVILDFDASPETLRKAAQLAREALGAQPARGDAVAVYALPAARAVSSAPPRPHPVPAASIPHVPAPQPAADAFPPLAAWAPAAGAAALLGLGLVLWRRRRNTDTPDAPAPDFDAEVETVRNQVLDDPRVAADVIKVWMRA